MVAFNAPIDIANRIFQRLGANRTTNLATDPSKQVAEFNAGYAAWRRSELRRNVWRFSIRRAALRAVGTALPAWDSTVTYVLNSLVSYSGLNYISIHATPNLNQNPATANTYWSVFTGNTSQKVTFPTWLIGTTYAAGAIVAGSDGSFYLSLVSGNVGNDPTLDTGSANWTLYFGGYVASAYAPGTSYLVGEIVFDTAQIAYYTTQNQNTNAPSTGIGWTTLTGATLAPIVIPWPAGIGPATDLQTRNIFVLPYGFLREAPQSPRQGDYSVLGYPSNPTRPDWEMEGAYMTSGDVGPILFRFAADITQVSLFDDLFGEGLSCRGALELSETITQSEQKKKDNASFYDKFMDEARKVNGIEKGATNMALDDYIATRA